MADEQKKESMPSGRMACMCPAGCTCGCGCGWARGHLLFRIIIGLILLALAFWAGVKVGEFKTIMARDMWGYNGGYRHSAMFYNGGYGGETNVVPVGASASGATGAATSGPVTVPAAQ